MQKSTIHNFWQILIINWLLRLTHLPGYEGFTVEIKIVYSITKVVSLILLFFSSNFGKPKSLLWIWLKRQEIFLFKFSAVNFGMFYLPAMNIIRMWSAGVKSHTQLLPGWQCSRSLSCTLFNPCCWFAAAGVSLTRIRIELMLYLAVQSWMYREQIRGLSIQPWGISVLRVKVEEIYWELWNRHVSTIVVYLKFWNLPAFLSVF